MFFFEKILFFKHLLSDIFLLWAFFLLFWAIFLFWALFFYFLSSATYVCETQWPGTISCLSCSWTRQDYKYLKKQGHCQESEVFSHYRTVSPGLRDNCESKCSSDSFWHTKCMSPCMESSQIHTLMYRCSPILGKRHHENRKKLPREHWVLEFCHSLSFFCLVTIWVLSYFEFHHDLSFVKIWALSPFKFCHNLSFFLKFF